MENMFIKPARPGLIVRDPATGKALDAAGENKPRDTYWIRRKNAGDVITATPPEDASAVKKDKKG